MAWFGKARQAAAPAPKRWTADLWREATDQSGRFHALAMVRGVKRQGQWIYGDRTMSMKREYDARLGCIPGSPVEHVVVGVQFDLDEHPYGIQHGDGSTLGLAYTGAFDHGGIAYPILTVRIWGDPAGAQAFEAAFDRAIASGQDHVPLWISANKPAAPMPGIDRFEAVQPLDEIHFEETVDLRKLARR